MAAAILSHEFSGVQAVGAEAATDVAQLSGVRKAYGKTVALDGLDLQVRSGEILGLLGPNGAGKTTAVRLLLGLTRPDKGNVRVFGQDPQHSATRVRLGSMLQVARVPETLKVREHLNLFRSYYPKPLSLDEVMATAGVSSIADKRFGDLSGGQKQRVLFGLAICGDPDLVFLDEPTVGMDIEARRALWACIEGLAAKGKSVLLTTHYLEEADALSHRIAVLNQGRVMVQGTPEQVKSLVQGKTVKCTTALDEAALRALPGVMAVARVQKQSVLTVADAEACVYELLTRDRTVRDLEVTSAALEDAFLALTAKN